jgi:high affinity Mn2+ porin
MRTFKFLDPRMPVRALLAAGLAATFSGVSRAQSTAQVGGDPPPAPLPTGLVSAPPSAAAWTLHEQATWIDQAHPSFPSPYEGMNSFSPEAQSARTFSFSLFMGYRLLADTEIYFNPEELQGRSLSNTVGIAGFPNGEGGKASFPNLHYNTSRLFLRQTFELGGPTQKADDDVNQVGRDYDVDRVTLSLGKFSGADFFDANSYSHDPRTQFMNWALLESAAWDFPADALGYTVGFVAEWNTQEWAVRYGIFMEPAVSNGTMLDDHVRQAHGQILEFDRRYSLGDLSGSLRPFLYWNQAHMGNYADALASPEIADALVASRAYRSKVGFGMSWDQALTKDLGAFVRLSWDDGRTESFAYTEVDRSAAAGLSSSGGAWGRKDDTLGIAAVVNGIVPGHQAYLAAGGTQGLILGDGALDYGPEEILEAYYSLQPLRWLSLSPDFQFVAHPGYNRSRGPVPVYSLRVHLEF